MSKKTATKTKKPTQLDRIERALSEDRAVRDGEQTAYAGSLVRVHRKLDDLSKRLTALESRSAPAEVWVPKVGELAMVPGMRIPQGYAHDDILFNGPVLIRGYYGGGTVDVTYGVARYDAIPVKFIRPATLQEIADHKAKEEQRAKEVEWAKFDELQDGDACAATSEEQDKVIAMSKDAGFLKGYTSSYRDPEGLTWKPDTYPDSPLQFGIHSSNVMPFTEWERRLRGTIAKRAEEERAKQLAKPLERGCAIRSKDGRNGVFLATEPIADYNWVVYQGQGHPPAWQAECVGRDSFTIID